MVGGEIPRLRAAWPGRRDPRSLFWSGGDLVLNIPTGRDLQLVHALVDTGRLCFDIEQDLGLPVLAAVAVEAPRLESCPVQLECRRGQVDTSPVEPEVSAEILLLHRGGEIVDMAADLNLAALQPLRVPSGCSWPAGGIDQSEDIET